MSRLKYYQISPEPFDKLSTVAKYLDGSPLDQKLRALVEIRVSQINGCVYCVVMHTKQARERGETQQRLDILPVWRESRTFDEKERAEVLTRVAETHAPDADYELLKAHFSEREIVDLSTTIALMNAWNRISVGFRNLP